jgi:hypothetical protein
MAKISSALKNKLHKTKAGKAFGGSASIQPSLKVGWQKEGFFVSASYLRYDKACGCDKCGRWWKPTRTESGQELCVACNPREKASA